MSNAPRTAKLQAKREPTLDDLIERVRFASDEESRYAHKVCTISVETALGVLRCLNELRERRESESNH